MVANHRIGKGTSRAVVPLMMMIIIMKEKEEEGENEEEEGEEKKKTEEEEEEEEEEEFCPVCATYYYSVLLCSIWLQPCINFTLGLLQTEHPTNGKQCKVTDAVTETSAVLQGLNLYLQG